MKIFLTGLLAGILTIANLSTATAATVRHEFDARVSSLFFVHPGGNIFPAGLSTAEVLDAFHPFAPLQNQTFSTVIEITEDPTHPGNTFPTIPGGTVATISCVSGPLCAPGTDRFKLVETHPHLGFSSSSRFTTDPTLAGGYERLIELTRDPASGAAELTIFSDFFTNGFSGTLNGQQYILGGPSAKIALTPAAPAVPLPASVLLLGAGLVPLAALRRRKNRA